MRKVSKLLLVSAFSLSFTVTASAQVIVQNGGAARDCYFSTKTNDQGSSHATKTCRLALSEFLDPKDKAATHINLGILLMRKGDHAAAKTQYAKAIKLRPKLAEAHINLAASQIHTGNYSGAVKSIDTAIDIGTEKMPEALYNRAIAYDRLQNYKGAYADLKQALALRPDWEPAVNLLSGYQVKRRTKS